MSTSTQHAALAANALKTATMWRRLGDDHAAELSVTSCQHHAAMASANANTKSQADADAVSSALKCAAQAADVGGASGGGLAWRTPGTGSVVDAKRVLEKLHQRAVRRGVRA